MGLLSYSLVKDGLGSGGADWQPPDGRIWLREWLEYAIERVPKLYQALQDGDLSVFRDAARGVKLIRHDHGYEHSSLQTPVLFDFRRSGQTGVLLLELSSAAK